MAQVHVLGHCDHFDITPFIKRLKDGWLFAIQRICGGGGGDGGNLFQLHFYILSFLFFF